MNLIVLFIAACAFGATTAAPPSPEELQIKSKIDGDISKNQIQLALELYEHVAGYKWGRPVALSTAGLCSALFLSYYGADDRKYRRRIAEEFGFPPDSRPADLAITDFIHRSKQIEESEGSKTAIVILHSTDREFKTDFEEKMNSMLSSKEWHRAIPNHWTIEHALDVWIGILDIGSFDNDNVREKAIKSKGTPHPQNDRFRIVTATSLRTKLHCSLYNAKLTQEKVTEGIFNSKNVTLLSATAKVIYGKYKYTNSRGTTLKVKFIKLPWAGVENRKLWSILIIPPNPYSTADQYMYLSKELIDQAVSETNESFVYLEVPQTVTVSVGEDFTKYPYAKPSDESSHLLPHGIRRSKYKPPDALSWWTDPRRMFTEETGEESDLISPFAYYTTRTYEMMDNVTRPFEEEEFRAEHEFVVKDDMLIVDILQDENPIILSMSSFRYVRPKRWTFELYKRQYKSRM